MINVAINDYTLIIAFLLCFLRWSAMLMHLPLLDEMNVPVNLKILFSLSVTFLFFPLVKASMMTEVQMASDSQIMLLVLFNVLIGLFFGLLLKLIMTVFVTAGSLMSQQMGFFAIRYFDPNQSDQTGPIETLLRLGILMLIVSSGALLPMIKGFYLSFHNFNLIGTFAHFNKAIFFQEFFVQLFHSAILLATPLIFINLLLMSVMGIMARVVPQMNVLMISFVINIFVGLLVLLLVSDEMFFQGFKIYTRGLAAWFNLIQGP